MLDKTEFLDVVKSVIKRDGTNDLIKFLEATDFFTAPASTKYHDSFEGGLAAHSLRVYYKLNDLLSGLGLSYDQETIAIVALFHDLCKIGYYVVDYRNTKDEKGNWIKVPYYTVCDQVPLGHGEKSVMMIRDVMELSAEEQMTIRWHMGAYEPKENYGTLAEAYKKYPLAMYLHFADMMATYSE